MRCDILKYETAFSYKQGKGLIKIKNSKKSVFSKSSLSFPFFQKESLAKESLNCYMKV